MKATCSKSKTTVSAGFCSSFVTVFSEILILFISIPVFFKTHNHYLTNYMPTYFSGPSSMIANNSGSSHHTEKDLWLQVLALAKEIQDCKSYLYPKTLESIYDNIVRIEKLLDILLIITRRSDK